MTTIKKLLVYGCIDTCTCVTQLVVTATCTLISIYLLFKTYSVIDKTEFSLFLVPTVDLVMTVLIFLVNVGQILSARQLIRVATNRIHPMEIENVKSNWNYWNKRSLVTIFIWFPFIYFWMFVKYHLSPGILLACFAVILGSRLILTWGMRTVHYTTQMDPVVGSSSMEEAAIEMQQVHEDAEDEV